MLEDTTRVVRAAVPNPIFTDLWEILFFTIILYSAREDNRVSLPFRRIKKTEPARTERDPDRFGFVCVDRRAA